MRIGESTASERPSLKLDLVAVETAFAEFLRTVPGIAHALTQTDLLAGRVTHILLLAMVQRAFHPTRSGDDVIVQQQLWHLYPEAGGYAALDGVATSPCSAWMMRSPRY